MSDLAARLVRRIAAGGPITIAEFMATALYDPLAGYYTTGRPLGRAGDFITAPEVSQMFGELLGLWCADTWQRLGSPRPLRLIELGPGRGTLLTDVLRALKLVPAMREGLELHLVEVSRELRREQERAFVGFSCQWHANLAEVPDGPFLLLANEFFDALPIRQFERAPDAWRERLVGLAPDGGLRVALSGPVPPALIPAACRGLPPGAVAELCPAALSLAGEIGRRVAMAPGAALIVDYGYDTPPGRGTLQAVRGHARAEPLAAPGGADLSAHVDFAALSEAARQAGASVHGPVGQGSLLRALGIELRAARLKAAAPAQAEAIEAALHRLTAEEAMGGLFKALALLPPGLDAPAGF